MQKLIGHILRYDWLLLGAVFLLVTFGLLTLFSLAQVNTVPFFQRQIFWLIASLVLLVTASLIDFRFFRSQSIVVLLLYGVAVFLLLVVDASGAVVRGVVSWIKIGSLTIQPVEPAKLALIILLAKFFSKRHIEIYQIRHLVISGVYMAIPALLVLIQPDLGSAIVIIAIWLMMVLFSGMRMRHLLVLILIAAIVGSIGWGFVLRPYQKARITTFLNPYADEQGAGYQMIQAMITVGSGRIWGKGLGYGSQSHLSFLPEAQTDFIFAAFAEEWGFVGVVLLFAALSCMLWRILVIGMRSADNFSRLYAIGLAAFIFVQSVIHIGMNMGLMPITGITLPFVSYGGSSLATLCIGVGILMNISMNARRVVE